jgi:hypothetical protein
MKKELLSQERRDLFSKIFIAGAGSLALLSLTGCNDSDNTSVSSKTVQLTADQEYLLLYMYQEEKVARDVYYYLGNIYTAENTFAYIQISEQRHMDACEKLCIKYGIDISAVDETVYGEFILPELQDLYDTLIAQGAPSLSAALEVGILIEETDITDLDDAIAAMPSDASDIIRVFSNIQEGSFNHLEAFTYSLDQLTP